MEQQTPLSKLIQYIASSQILTNDEITQKAKQLLVEEKEMIEQNYSQGYEDGYTQGKEGDIEFCLPNEYFNKKFISSAP